MDELERLIQEYGRAVYGLCRKLTGSSYDADDLYQQTFITAMNKNIDYSKNPKAMLMKICITQWKSQLQKQTRRKTIAPQDSYEEKSFEVFSDEDTESVVIHREEVRLVRKALFELEDRYRLPLFLLYTSGLTVREAAQALSLPEGTVKSRAYRGKAIIKKKLEEARLYE